MKLILAILLVLSFSSLGAANPVGGEDQEQSDSENAPGSPISNSCSYDGFRNSSPDKSTKALMIKSITSGCPEIMASILKNQKEDEVFDATKSYLTGATEF